MAHKTLINGTTYDVSGGTTLVSGSTYNISGGKTLVNGTTYDISFGSTPSGQYVLMTDYTPTTYLKMEGTTWGYTTDISNATHFTKEDIDVIYFYLKYDNSGIDYVLGHYGAYDSTIGKYIYTVNAVPYTSEIYKGIWYINTSLNNRLFNSSANNSYSQNGLLLYGSGSHDWFYTSSSSTGGVGIILVEV